VISFAFYQTELPINEGFQKAGFYNMLKGLSILRKTKRAKSGNSLVSMGEKTIIGEQVSFEGSMRGNEDLLINGSVKGSIELHDYHLTVAPKGQVQAEIYAKNVTISGRLVGNIKATCKVDITKEADFSGEIKAKHISVEDGAYLKAVIELDREPQKKAEPADKTAEQAASRSEKEPLTLVSDAESLAISAHHPWEDTSLEPDPASNVVRLFLEGLKEEGEVLDVGPVCGENISFFAQRVKRLYVCDMFLRLDQERRKSLPISWVWQHLDYPPQSFDGILLWNLIDCLDDNEVGRLVELCHNIVRSGGMVMVFVLAEQAIRTVVNSFVIGEGIQLDLRPQPHLDIPFHIRQNREVLALLAPFIPIKSFIYQKGLRQFLFQRD